ncbi:UNVERIFIED_CONTAM: hypothetical protein FKN15_027399 [Acipenser sinensis]
MIGRNNGPYQSTFMARISQGVVRNWGCPFERDVQTLWSRTVTAWKKTKFEKKKHPTKENRGSGENCGQTPTAEGAGCPFERDVQTLWSRTVTAWKKTKFEKKKHPTKENRGSGENCGQTPTAEGAVRVGRRPGPCG